MNTVLEKAIKRQPITDADLRMELADICEANCGQCDSSCPVYELNGQKIVRRKGNPKCVCLRNGGAMLQFIREYYISLGLMQRDDQEMAAELTEICERVHSSCGRECPVWVANGGKTPMHGAGVNRGCLCFKDGTAMQRFLRKVEAMNRAKAEACIGEELCKPFPKENPKITSSHRQKLADKEKVDKQTEGWIKVIRGKRRVK